MTPALAIEQELRAEFAFGKCAKKERRGKRRRSNLVCIECGLCGEEAAGRSEPGKFGRKGGMSEMGEKGDNVEVVLFSKNRNCELQHTGSSSYLRTALPKSSSRPLPAC